MSDLSKNKRFVRIERYDALTGKHIRDIKPTDIFTLNNSITASTMVASTIVGANFDLFVHRIEIGCAATNQHIAIMENATTKMLIPMNARNSAVMESQSRDLPLFRVAASSTLKIKTVSGISTVIASLHAVREPIISKVETT